MIKLHRTVTLFEPLDWREGRYAIHYRKLIGTIRHTLEHRDIELRVTELAETRADSDIDAIKLHLEQHPTDGLIIPRSDISLGLSHYISETGLPAVLYGSPKRDLGDISFVDTDNYAAFYEMAQYIMSLGHRAIAFLNGYPELSYAHQREQGFRAAAADRGLPLREDWFFYGKPTQGVGSLMATQALKRGGAPTALICATDEIAEGAIDTCRTLGMIPGKDITITGYGDAPSFTSDLTTLRFDLERIGRELSRIIADQIDGLALKPEQVRIHCELIQGKTAGFPGQPSDLETALLSNQRTVPGGFYSVNGFAGALNHYERAQRLAGVGSWRYDLVKQVFELSSEACSLLGLKPKPTFKLDELIGRFDDPTQHAFLNAWERGIEGRYFSVTTALKVPTTARALDWAGDFVVNSDRLLICAEGIVKRLS